MGRAPCCDKANVKKGPWSPEEDSKLKDYIEKYGTGGNWIALPQKAGLKRCGKSCRLRWLNYLRPNIKHGEFTDDEDRIICTLFASIGSRWSIIAAQLPGRTDNDIKNYWNTKLKKKLMAMNGIPSQPQRKTPPPPPPFSHQPQPVSSLYEDSTAYYYTPFEPIMSSAQSDLLNNTNLTNNSSLIQTPESLFSHMQYHPMRDNFLMFGGEPSCSSSDGSYGKEMKQEDHMGFQGFGASLDYGTNNGVNQWIEKQSGYSGECPLDYNLEDVKRLISSNNNSLFIDENDTQDKEAMYCYYY
ncbi:hypothetical protein Golob_001849 [Gossypium lobatum]|uniref:Transcription factor RAX2 n=1 Tax=Gossypium lobatum TaxID=34289 RepID=A0A7J8NCF9_9ROSI|nr:hypothetical protein [Gossypium lobatum]